MPWIPGSRPGDGRGQRPSEADSRSHEALETQGPRTPHLTADTRKRKNKTALTRKATLKGAGDAAEAGKAS